jgi:hypothetical protein
VINRFLNTEGRINALLEIVPSLHINEDELSGEMQKWYTQLKEQPLPGDNAPTDSGL